MNPFFKTLLKRPFTFVELRTEMDSFLGSPALSDDFRDMLAAFKSRKGQSFLDDFRERFESKLTEIAHEPTWRAQRAMLIKKALIEASWQSGYIVAQDCKHLESWKYFFTSAFAEGEIADDQLPFLLFQRNLEAILSMTGLEELGQKRFLLTVTKVTEIDLYREFDKEVKRFSTSMNEAMFDFRERDDVRAGEILGKYVTPINRDQIDLLSVAEEQIVNGSLDVAAFRKSFEAIKLRKQSAYDDILEHPASETESAEEQTSVSENTKDWLRKYIVDDAKGQS